MNKIEITNLEIKIGDKILKLDLAEILELKKILNDTFPDQKDTFIPYLPIYEEKYPRPSVPYQPYEIWYANKVAQINSRNTMYLSTGSQDSANL